MTQQIKFKYFIWKDFYEIVCDILFLFLDSEGSQTAVIILKDFTIYRININCTDEYYLGTIFDISYCEDNIIIYDTFMISGNKINKFEDLKKILSEYHVPSVERSNLSLFL